MHPNPKQSSHACTKKAIPRTIYRSKRIYPSTSGQWFTIPIADTLAAIIKPFANEKGVSIAGFCEQAIVGAVSKAQIKKGEQLPSTKAAPPRRRNTGEICEPTTNK